MCCALIPAAAQAELAPFPLLGGSWLDAFGILNLFILEELKLPWKIKNTVKEQAT